MGLTRLPTRTDDSIGRVKADLRDAENLINYLLAREYNVLADTLVELARAVGLADGTTPGSLEQRMIQALDDAQLAREEAAAAAALSFFETPCDATLAPGDAVCVVGGTAFRADPSNPARMPAVGVVASKSSPTTARVQTALLLRGVYSGLSPGRIHFVGANGRPVSTPPTATAPGEEVDQQPIGFAVSSTTLRVSPSTELFIHRF